MNINLKPFPYLTTERLILRKLSVQDSNDLMHLRSNDRVNAYLDRNKAITILEAKAFISKILKIIKNQEGVYWVISLKTDNALIGTICLYNFVLEDDIAEIGYELTPEYHGQGIMQEAIAKVIYYSFNQMQVKVIAACARADNVSSTKLLQRNGFTVDPAYQYLNGDDASEYLIYCLKQESQ